MRGPHDSVAAALSVVAAIACTGVGVDRTQHIDGDRDAGMTAGAPSYGDEAGVGGSGGASNAVDAAPIYYGFDAGSEGAEGNSCEGLPQTCGVDGTDDCCRSLLVPGGTFNRSQDGDSATVSDFRLDKYEVTGARFERFLEAWHGRWRPLGGGGKHLHLNGGQGLANRADPGGFEPGWQPIWAEHVSGAAALGTGNHAVDNINWYEAYAFCIWDGGFLPSEAEWAYAAAGGGEQRTWPWGEEHYCSGTCDDTRIAHCYGGGPSQLPVGVCYSTDLVGIRPPGDGRWGHSDLIGNAAEWTLDGLPAGVGEAFSSGTTDDPPYIAGCEDCAYAAIKTTFRIDRGGSFLTPTTIVDRGLSPAETRVWGVRCARPPEKQGDGGR